MRTTMLAAVFLFAACGTVKDKPGATGDDDGSASGSDDAGVPTACTSAADCPAGYACDISTSECVMGALTIEPTEQVVVEGNRWWTAATNPILQGTFEGPTGSVVEVAVGSEMGMPATLTGTTWQMQLPPSSIAPADTTITVTLKDPSGGVVELKQLFKLDADAPQIALGTSKVRDERGDTISFTSGEPIHTHAGVEIDLGANSCASVYKYTYLMSAQGPAFGSQVSQNALAWNFTVNDVKVVSASYRLRGASNQVLADWQPVMAPNNGTYRVELDRDMYYWLYTYTGTLTVDLRARDWAGLESTISKCVDFHPLAPPLQIEALQPTAGTLANIPNLSSLSLTTDAEVSRLAGFGLGASIVSQRIVQYTDAPITLSLTPAVTGLQFSRSYIDDYVLVQSGSGTSCNNGGCAATVPADPADSATSGPVGQNSMTVGLIDEETGDFLLDTTIPARGPNDPPHAYRVVAYLGQLAQLRAPSTAVPGEFSLLGLGYTGLAPGAPITVCTETVEICKSLGCFESCSRAETYQRMVALDHATLAMDSVSIDLRTSLSPSQAGMTPSYVPASAFSVGAISWDSGDDDLPGPK